MDNTTNPKSETEPDPLEQEVSAKKKNDAAKRYAWSLVVVLFTVDEIKHMTKKLENRAYNPE